MLDLHSIDMKTPNLTKNSSKTGKTDLKGWILEAQVYINEQENRATTKAFILFFLGAILVTYIRKQFSKRQSLIIVFIRNDILKTKKLMNYIINKITNSARL